MSRLVLKNVSSMDVFVPTPNGAGRKVAPGQCVEGSFFNPIRVMRHMAIVDANSVNPKDIICVYEVITAGLISNAATARDSAVMGEPSPVVKLAVPNPTPVTPKATPSPILSPNELSIEDVRDIEAANVDAAAKIAEVTAPKKEFSKYNLEELKAAAIELGIGFEEKATRRQLLNAIIARNE